MNTTTNTNKENAVTVQTTKKNHIFTIQREVSPNEWVRVSDALFPVREQARATVRQYRSTTGGNYRVRKMIVAEGR